MLRIIFGYTLWVNRIERGNFVMTSKKKSECQTEFHEISFNMTLSENSNFLNQTTMLTFSGKK